MTNRIRKIINDPVYGFITIDDPLVFQVISHPWYQRLRRINQMAFAHLVYPGAVHTRLHHSLGAYHLMCSAVSELQRKGFPISDEEALGVKIAILLHDVGHGPFSHALENVLIRGVHHETLSLEIMKVLNEDLEGKLGLAIEIFTGAYSKRFLHQLVSGQLDMDRMDYLTRDSFFTGVSEGVIGYDRILKMLTVHHEELMVEEKGIYSIEKFLVARRLMYWQVYLHKTALCAEKMLVNIIRRAREIQAASASAALNIFLNTKFDDKKIEQHLDNFCKIDDYDVLFSIKMWASHPDTILSYLCSGIINRRLLKIKFSGTAFNNEMVETKMQEVKKIFSINDAGASYLVFSGEITNETYSKDDERIKILYKDGTVSDISEVNNALINQTLFGAAKKFYICFPKEGLK